MVLEQLFFGIYLEKSSHGKVYHNRIIGDAVDEYNSGNGIQLWYSSDVEVRKNHVQGTRDGIYLEFSDRITITDNVSMDNLRYGLHFMFSNNDIYTNNTFENNGAGVAVMFSKSIGINIEGSNRIKYINNDFVGNGWAIRVVGACYTNSFKGNNFLYNSFDISYNSKLNDNVFEGNFWSGYTGYDLDKDGIGDVPYRPVKLFSYVVNRTPETIVLLRSLFMDIIDFSERVSPVFTPDNLKDVQPLMKIRP
jgi:nitrous oxidase accessory protein